MKKQYIAKINYKDTNQIIKIIEVKIDFNQLECDSISVILEKELKFFISDILDDMLDTGFIVES